MEISRLEKSIGYEFKNKDLIKTALTHISYANENGIESNEKLEFLGDSVLQILSSRYLYKNHHNLKEGEMTKVRASVVCEKSLYKIALLHNFSDFLYLGKSELHAGERNRVAILADSVEAVIAAIYIDGGLECANNFIIGNLEKEIKIATENVGTKDYKTVLQEKLQERGDVKIEYIIIKEIGPDHDKEFETEVRCDGEMLARGIGKSKKEAHMQAAKIALENI